jgi:hypothetical protein
MEKVIEREVKSFREVHADLENESSLLSKNHNIMDFKRKGDFLMGAGFRNSIATKLYAGIAENHHLFDEYTQKYKGQFKFILAPQLERICEKYNLYVRNTEFFLGDIPDPNIKDIMNFRVHLNDMPYYVAQYAIKKLGLSSSNVVMDFSGTSSVSHFNGYNITLVQYAEVLSHLATERTRWNNQRGGESMDGSVIAAIREASTCGLQIAAIKSMFSDMAFVNNARRIMSSAELAATAQVDLDPIVLLPLFKQTKSEQQSFFMSQQTGYLIVTAWGDEANDELVMNPKKN